MDEEVSLRLPRLFVGQVVIALEEQKSAWDYTALYLTHGCVESDHTIKEASSSQEAQRMADYYGKIINCIQSQVPGPSCTSS